MQAAGDLHFAHCTLHYLCRYKMCFEYVLHEMEFKKGINYQNTTGKTFEADFPTASFSNEAVFSFQKYRIALFNNRATNSVKENRMSLTINNEFESGGKNIHFNTFCFSGALQRGSGRKQSFSCEMRRE